MKEPLTFEATLTDAAGNRIATYKFEHLKQSDVVAIQETVGDALTTLGRAKLAEKQSK
jgi:hypothetical protein